MKIQMNLGGTTRKAMVNAISEILGTKAVYQGMPTAAYKVGVVTVDKDGSLVSEDEELLSGLAESLSEAGFTSEEETVKLTVEIPAKGFTEATQGNLDRIIESKGTLIMKAICAESLDYEVTEDKVRFPWFTLTGDTDEGMAYTQFITALVEMARNQKRVTAKQTAPENEKYAFRCFLLRLGFIGDEYKAARKILLRNLSGSSAWKDGGRNE